MGMSAEGRREAIQRAMQALAEPGSVQESIQLPYKDGNEGPFKVIKVSVDAVLFNPRSHRIKAQLESHPKRQLVADDPYSDAAQEVIREILRETEGFDALKGNLSLYGQRDPGVVTHDGLLVNANTRLAALRELGMDYIRAALLPSDADEHAIDRLELELQVQRDFKQDYTLTNELIFINELLNNHGYSEEKAAKALNWAASSDEKELRRGIDRVRQSVRLYALVRYIQSLSDGAIPLTFFDDKRQALIDLDEKYESLKDSDPDGAERTRNARIAGILSGNFYRVLRQIDSDSSLDELIPRIEEKEILGEEIEELTEPSNNGVGGDDDAELLGGGEVAEVDEPDLQPLVMFIAKTHGEDEVELPSGKKVERDEVVREIAEAIDDAAEEVQLNKRVSRNLSSPIKQLEEAVKKAKAAADGYKQFCNAQGFKKGKFEYLTKKLDTQVSAIKKAIEQQSG